MTTENTTGNEPDATQNEATQNEATQNEATQNEATQNEATQSEPDPGITAVHPIEVPVPPFVSIVQVQRGDETMFARVEVDFQTDIAREGRLFPSEDSARSATPSDIFWLPYIDGPSLFTIDDEPLFMKVVPRGQVTVRPTVLVSSANDLSLVELFSEVVVGDERNQVSQGWLVVDLVGEPKPRLLGVPLFHTSAEALFGRRSGLRVSKEPGLYPAYAVNAVRDCLVTFTVEVAEPVEAPEPPAEDQPVSKPDSVVLLDQNNSMLRLFALTETDAANPALSEVTPDQILNRNQSAPQRKQSASERLGVHYMAAPRPTDPKAGR